MHGSDASVTLTARPGGRIELVIAHGGEPHFKLVTGDEHDIRFISEWFSWSRVVTGALSAVDVFCEADEAEHVAVAMTFDVSPCVAEALCYIWIRGDLHELVKLEYDPLRACFVYSTDTSPPASLGSSRVLAA